MRFTEEEYQQLQERRALWEKPEPQADLRRTQQVGTPLENAAPAPKPRKADPEHQEQKALVEWCDLQGHPYSEVFAIPNGGGRSKMEAGKLKAEGVKAGVPDLFLPVASGIYHGLFIEMKAKGGRLRPEQTEKLTTLAIAGYYCAVAYGWEDAAVVMQRYWRMPADLPARPWMAPQNNNTRKKSE